MYAMQNLCITAFPYGVASLIELDFYSRLCDVVKPAWALLGATGYSPGHVFRYPFQSYSFTKLSVFIGGVGHTSHSAVHASRVNCLLSGMLMRRVLHTDDACLSSHHHCTMHVHGQL